MKWAYLPDDKLGLQPLSSFESESLQPEANKGLQAREALFPSEKGAIPRHPPAVPAVPAVPGLEDEKHPSTATSVAFDDGDKATDKAHDKV